MTKTFFARPALIAAAAIATFAALPAHAQPTGGVESTQIAINFDGVDMTSDAAVSSLRAKVRHAAETACRPDGNTPAEVQLNKSCLRTALTRGNAQIDALHTRALAANGQGRSLAANSPDGAPAR